MGGGGGGCESNSFVIQNGARSSAIVCLKLKRSVYQKTRDLQKVSKAVDTLT